MVVAYMGKDMDKLEDKYHIPLPDFVTDDGNYTGLHAALNGEVTVGYALYSFEWAERGISQLVLDVAIAISYMGETKTTSLRGMGFDKSLLTTLQNG